MARKNRQTKLAQSVADAILPELSSLKAEGAKAQAVANVCTATDLADVALCFALAVTAAQGPMTGEDLDAGLSAAGKSWSPDTRKVRLSEFNQGARAVAVIGLDATLAGIEYAAQQARAIGGHAFRAALSWLREVKRPEGTKRNEAASAKDARVIVRDANAAVVAKLTQTREKARAPQAATATGTASKAKEETAAEFATDAGAAKHAANVLCRLAGEVAQRKSPALAKLAGLLRDAIEEANVQAKRG
jgi:hypothetical protein